MQQVGIPAGSPVHGIGIDEQGLEIAGSSDGRIATDHIGVAQIAVNVGIIPRLQQGGLEGRDGAFRQAGHEIDITGGRLVRQEGIK